MNYITHYYRVGDRPFKSLSTLSQDKAIEVIQRFNSEEALVYRRFKNPKKYLEERKTTENWIRHEFIKKGGKPAKGHPHYLVLVESEYIYEGYNRNCEKIHIPISSIDKAKISFTYPDSMISYWLAKSKKNEKFYQNKYHGRVFTFDEIIELLDEVKPTARIWEEDETRAYDFFIEAQLWSDDPILNYI